jgi:hypothetical protein
MVAVSEEANSRVREPQSKEDRMISTALSRTAALAAVVIVSVMTAATAQTTTVDPHHPDTTSAQTTPPAKPGDMLGQGQSTAPGQRGMMSPGMSTGTGQGMMQPGMMEAMPMTQMRGHMIKVMFAIADTDGDGALSFEEITAIHRRIFDKVDANKDGKVTTEEVRAFMRD